MLTHCHLKSTTATAPMYFQNTTAYTAGCSPQGANTEKKTSQAPMLLVWEESKVPVWEDANRWRPTPPSCLKPICTSSPGFHRSTATPQTPGLTAHELVRAPSSFQIDTEDSFHLAALDHVELSTTWTVLYTAHTANKLSPPSFVF